MGERELIVLGGSGYIGSCLQQHLENRNMMDRVHFVLRSNLRTQTRSGKVFFHFGKIIDILESILSAQEKKKQFAVINLIGRVTNDVESLREIENITGTIYSILEEKKITKLLHISSSAVYGGILGTGAVKEGVSLIASNHYGQSKINQENFLRSLPIKEVATIVRIGNVLGGDSLTRQINLKEPQEIMLDYYQNGRSAMRSYIDPVNLSKILLNLVKLESLGLEIFNCAASKPFYMEDVLKSFNIKFNLSSLSGIENQYLALDTGRLAKKVDHELDYDLDEMVKNTLATKLIKNV